MNKKVKDDTCITPDVQYLPVTLSTSTIIGPRFERIFTGEKMQGKGFALVFTSKNGCLTEVNDKI